MALSEAVPPTPDPAELLTLARETADAAARLLRVRRAGQLRLETKSSVSDLVTDVDHAAERLIVDRLLAARPDDGVNGEEGTRRAGTSGVVWHIDPIDGTTNFVYGLPGFAVSIAAEVDGDTIVGVVADVLHEETFWALRGGGSWLDDQPIRCGETTDLGQALVATGFSYLSERRQRQAVILTQVLPAVRDIRRLGAASTDLAAVACGRVDAFYEKGLNPWDHAAGVLIAREAGAVAGDLHGGAPSDRFVLVAAPGIFTELRDLLRSAGAADA